MRSKLIFLIFFCCGSYLNVIAQTVALDQRIVGLTIQADSISKTINQLDPALIDQVDHFKRFVLTEVNDLQGSLKKNEYSAFDYSRLINDSQNNLNIVFVALRSKDTASIKVALNHVLRDMAIKIYMTGDKGGKEASRLEQKPVFVKLAVKVFNRSQQEISGYDVFVKPEYSLDPELIEQFNPTNHAVKKIIPGVKKGLDRKKRSKNSRTQS